MRWILLILPGFLFSATTSAQLCSYQPEQIDSLQSAEQRIVVIFAHTDWCRFCDAMKATTFKYKALVALLNDQFYFVSLDAGTKKTIRFMNKDYLFKNSEGHEFVNWLNNNNKSAYPSLFFLSNNQQPFYKTSNYINAKELLKLLKFVQGV